MSDTFKRRRKRTGSTSARFNPSQLVAMESVRPVRMGKAEIAACGAVVLVVIALVALIWVVTSRTVHDQRTVVRERAEQALTAQASVMAETIGHELLMIDQSLTILQAAWKADSDSVDLIKWQKQMPALTAVADDLFICDETHIIRQDILPQAVGQGVGAAYVTFPHGSLETFDSDGTKDEGSLLLTGSSGETIDARHFLMYIVRPLDHPKGWLIGASYRSTELTKLFAEAGIGYNSVVALVDTTHGALQAVAGPAARRPKTDLSKTTLFGLISRSPAGTWTGKTGIDDVERLHAFHRVADRNMAGLGGANQDEVMAPADTLVAGSRALASVATALVVSFGGLVLCELYTLRGRSRQKRTFDRNRSELERLRLEEAGNLSRAKLNAARLQVVVDSTSDGVALFDSGLRLVQWNHPFLRGIGIEPRKDMPLDALLRDQAAKGLFAALPDIEAEIARRTGLLRTGDAVGLSQPGPGGETLFLRGLPIAEGGFILLLSGIARVELAPAASTVIDEAAAPDGTVKTPIEW